MFNKSKKLLNENHNLRVTCDFSSIDLDFISKSIRKYAAYPHLSLSDQLFLIDIADRVDKVSSTLYAERPFKKNVTM